MLYFSEGVHDMDGFGRCTIAGKLYPFSVVELEHHALRPLLQKSSKARLNENYINNLIASIFHEKLMIYMICM